jgi:hypothetical protein
MSDALFAVAMAYRIVYSIVGSYIVAWLAPVRPMAHALALGVIGTVVSIVGAVVTWNAGPEFGPHWYPVVLCIFPVPCAWIGARLHAMGSTRKTA